MTTLLIVEMMNLANISNYIVHTTSGINIKSVFPYIVSDCHCEAAAVTCEVK